MADFRWLFTYCTLSLHCPKSVLFALYPHLPPLPTAELWQAFQHHPPINYASILTDTTKILRHCNWPLQIQRDTIQSKTKYGRLRLRRNDDYTSFRWMGSSRLPLQGWCLQMHQFPWQNRHCISECYRQTAKEKLEYRVYNDDNSNFAQVVYDLAVPARPPLFSIGDDKFKWYPAERNANHWLEFRKRFFSVWEPWSKN